MKLYKKQAFSLTELLIVLVVVAVLFAALAPIMTKRRNGANVSNESVWNFVTNDDQMDSFFDPGVPGWTSTAYIGYNPTPYGISSPAAKVVIKAKPKQRQIQFRYGTGNGINAGSLFVDDRSNIMLASNNNYFVDADISNGNTVAGIGAFSKVRFSNYAIAYGPFAMAGSDANTDFGENDKIIAVGNIVARNFRSTGNLEDIFIGSGSGRTRYYPYGSIALGSNSMSSEASAGNYNIYLGYDTGGGEASTTTSINQYNVIAGSSYVGKTSASNYPRYNTILGYDVYASGNPQIRNLTAAGYGACNSISSVNDGTRTCIGYSSGAAINGTNVSGDPYNTDKYEHIFLGGVPLGGFAGRSVLEVHNHVVDKTKIRKSPQVSPTVIMNSNLVVRGNVFFPYDNGGMASFRHIDVSRQIWERTNDQDHCKKWGGMFGRRDWRHGVGWRKKDTHSNTYLEYRQYCLNRGDMTGYNLSTQCPRLSVSDIRLKDNITDNESGLREILSILPYNYTFKADKNRTPQTGVIAQDLQKVFPISVNKGDDGYLRIRWDEMFYAAINAIKSLDKKIEKLAADISSMESDVKNLKSNHKVLQKRIASLNARATKLERK